jgi:hypothetical protein
MITEDLRDAIKYATIDDAIAWSDSDEKTIFLCERFDLNVTNELDLAHEGGTAQDVLEDRLEELLKIADTIPDNPFSKEQVLKICELALEGEGLKVHLERTRIGINYEGVAAVSVPLTFTDEELDSHVLADMFLKIEFDGHISYQNNGGCKFKIRNALKVYEILLEVLGD